LGTGPEEEERGIVIVSASRRTDLPAFYADWFMKRIRAGFCHVVNPFNPNQRSYVSLNPEDVEIIVFWTRNPHGLLPHLEELDNRGYRYYFLYTLLDYPSLLEPKAPPLLSRLETFKRLADRIGAERVVWRYDPIVLSTVTDVPYHLCRFDYLASELAGYTLRVIVSLLDVYAKVRRRLKGLETKGFRLFADDIQALADLMPHLAQTARASGMEIQSCAEKHDLRCYGIEPGACIDPELIEQVFDITVTRQKDPGQRSACRCVLSKDIGSYETCRGGCLYCYAT
jgi:DNA repair photolyase